MASFRKSEAFGQTVLPDRSILIGPKIGGKCQNLNIKCDILGDFQTLCRFEIWAEYVENCESDPTGCPSKFCIVYWSNFESFFVPDFVSDLDWFWTDFEPIL